MEKIQLINIIVYIDIFLQKKVDNCKKIIDTNFVRFDINEGDVSFRNSKIRKEDFNGLFR
jgi:hypothetical protein